MDNTQKRILLVDDLPETIDLISNQTLLPLGYVIEVVHSVGIALNEFTNFSPDIIIARNDLPDLTGTDLLIALSSNEFDTPFILMAEKGKEANLIQAFRLGAADILLLPLREAELITAVERAFNAVSSKRDRENLSRQLKQTNAVLKRRVRDLSAILSIGKAVTTVTDMRQLFDQIVEGAVYISEADMGWLLLREKSGENYNFVAQHNLPASFLIEKIRLENEGLSSLISLSGASLVLNELASVDSHISELGKSALIVPVKLRNQVIGILVVIRKEQNPFNSMKKRLLEAVADFASLALLNSFLFQALEKS